MHQPQLNLWHPNAGVTEVNVALGAQPVMTVPDAIALFSGIPAVKAATTTDAMWHQTGRIDLTLTDGGCHELPGKLRNDLLDICKQVLATN